jgi:hypothetical protein
MLGFVHPFVKSKKYIVPNSYQKLFAIDMSFAWARYKRLATFK